MYMIRVSGDSDIAAIGKTNTNVKNYPADRCGWEDSEVITNTATGSQVRYIVKNGLFFPGTGDNVGVQLDMGDAAANTIVLGYINKTGRFVAITDPK